MTSRFAVVVAVALTAVSTLHGSVRIDSNKWFSPPPLEAPVCREGTTPIMPLSSSVSAHGAFYYNYAVDEHTFSAIVPPSGFDPLNADDDVLAEMNFPVRPTEPDALATWSLEMSAYRGTDLPSLCVGKPLSQPMDQVSTRSTSSLSVTPNDGATADHYWSHGWSGYVSNSGVHQKVVGHWTQNSAHACNCSGPTDAVYWVGLGGYTTGALIQAGTRNYSTDTPYAWFEYLHPCSGDCNISIQSADNVMVGDDIAAAVWYDPASNNYSMTVTDNGVYKLSEVGLLDSSYYDNTSAEFINERPVYCSTGCFKPVTNWVQTNWSYSRWYSGWSGTGQTTLSAGNTVGVVMTRDSNFHSPPCNSAFLLAYLENPSNGNFDSIWCRAS